MRLLQLQMCNLISRRYMQARTDRFITQTKQQLLHHTADYYVEARSETFMAQLKQQVLYHAADAAEQNLHCRCSQDMTTSRSWQASSTNSNVQQLRRNTTMLSIVCHVNVQYSTVQYSTVQYSTVQYSIIQHTTA